MKNKVVIAEKAAAEEPNPRGIPEFWFTIFRNVDMLSELVQVSGCSPVPKTVLTLGRRGAADPRLCSSGQGWQCRLSLTCVGHSPPWRPTHCPQPAQRLRLFVCCEQQELGTGALVEVSASRSALCACMSPPPGGVAQPHAPRSIRAEQIAGDSDHRHRKVSFLTKRISQPFCTDSSTSL